MWSEVLKAADEYPGNSERGNEFADEHPNSGDGESVFSASRGFFQCFF